MTPTDAELIHQLRNLITPDIDTDAVADRLAALSNDLLAIKLERDALAECFKELRDKYLNHVAITEAIAADRDRLEGMCAEVGERLARVSSENDEIHVELERLNLEVMRLREAMGKYADAMNWHCTEIGEYHEHSEKCCKDGWWTRSEHGYDVAREALQENHDGCG